ncbi:MAG: hypothetical protein WD072_05275 [Pirellulales bacterium]
MTSIIRIAAATSLLGAVLASLPAPAADDRVIEQREPLSAGNDIIGGNNFLVIGQPRPVEYDLGRMFDQQVFAQPRGNVQRGNWLVIANGRLVQQPLPKPADPAGDLATVRHRGERYITTIERICRLDPDQVRRLRMALESDLKRLASEIAGVRGKYTGGMVAAALGLDRDLLATLRTDAQACRQRIETALATGSLMAVVSRDVLGPEQEAVFDEWLAARRAGRWRAMVAAVLISLDESGLGLSEKQFTALEQSLLASVPPLDVWRSTTGIALDSRIVRFQSPLVLSLLGRRRADWQPLLDPRQQAHLDRLIEQAGDSAAVETLLVAQGILEEMQP